MNCLRCGRETSQQQVFCDGCLEYMSHQPVKSDTPIYLPVRKTKEAPRKQYAWRRRERTAEEMVTVLRKRVRFLTCLCLILFMMLFAAAAGVWMAKKQGADLSIPNIGQNFHTFSDIFEDVEED